MTEHTRYHCAFCRESFAADRGAAYATHVAIHVVEALLDQSEYCTTVWECDDCRRYFDAEPAYESHDCTPTPLSEHADD